MSEAEDAIMEHAIPAARKAGIQVVWLNWGLTDEDLQTLPPQQFRVFGWTCNIQDGRCGIDFPGAHDRERGGIRTRRGEGRS